MDYKKMHFSEVFIIVLAFTVILPIIVNLNDVYLRDLRKRPRAILFSILFYFICLIWLFLLDFRWALNRETHYYSGSEIYMPIYHFLLALLIVNMLIVSIISINYKISLHASGIGFNYALPFAFGGFHDMLPWNIWNKIFSEDIFTAIIIGFIICSSIVLWQRVASGAHSFWQVFWGFCCGFGITVLMETLSR